MAIIDHEDRRQAFRSAAQRLPEDDQDNLNLHFKTNIPTAKLRRATL